MLLPPGFKDPAQHQWRFLTVRFSLLQKTSICYLSFPDSYSGRWQLPALPRPRDVPPLGMGGD